MDTVNQTAVKYWSKEKNFFVNVLGCTNFKFFKKIYVYKCKVTSSSKCCKSFWLKYLTEILIFIRFDVSIFVTYVILYNYNLFECWS